MASGAPATIGGGGTLSEGGIPSAPSGGAREPAARVTLENASTARVTALPRVPGTAHVILAVMDNGRPALTAYRRVIFHIQPAR